MGIRATVNRQNTNRVSINVRNQIRAAINSSMGAEYKYLASLLDVDASNLINGFVLVYDSSVSKYVIKLLPCIDGGTF